MTSSRIWIGGGTGGGKSITAQTLAVRHGLRRFAMDSFWYAYDARWGQPRKSPDEQWLDTPPEVQAAEFEETSRRMMRFALDDLAELPDVPTVVEGPAPGLRRRRLRGSTSAIRSPASAVVPAAATPCS